MSRNATFEVLATNADLNALGITRDSIWHNWTLEERPNPTGPFVLLQWGAQDPPPFQQEPVKSPERLSLWLHFPKELNEDFTQIQRTLDLCDTALYTARDVVGSDGYTLSFVRATGRSGDLDDTGFNTISKNAGYEIFYRE
jgi:hypothetical protein